MSISLFFVIVVFYIVIVKAFIMLFRITGMTEEKARFQVISLITNSGYTTRESELVVDVLSRRKLARIIMLFGYTFSITVVSVFVNMMRSLPENEKDEIWPPLIIVSVLFVIFLIVWRIPVVKTAMDSIMEKLGRRWLYHNQGNAILVQDEYAKGVVASVTLNTLPPDLAGKTLRALRLEERYGIHVVVINRGGVMQMNADGSTELQQDDIATVFGPLNEIRHVFGHRAPAHSGLEMAPKPETEEEFIHEQDVKKAKAAAEKLRAEEERKSADRADGAGKDAAARPADGEPQKAAREDNAQSTAAPLAEKKDDTAAQTAADASGSQSAQKTEVTPAADAPGRSHDGSGESQQH